MINIFVKSIIIAVCFPIIRLTCSVSPMTAVYCDHTASGKSLRFIEDYIRDEVLPSYANTHTTSTNAALQTTSFR